MRFKYDTPDPTVAILKAIAQARDARRVARLAARVGDIGGAVQMREIARQYMLDAREIDAALRS